MLSKCYIAARALSSWSRPRRSPVPQIADRHPFRGGYSTERVPERRHTTDAATKRKYRLERFKLSAVDRELPNSLAGRREDCVCDRGYHSRRTRLTDASRSRRALDQMNVDREHHDDAQQLIVIEIALLDAAVLNRDLAE